jgi:hypothetical protein
LYRLSPGEAGEGRIFKIMSPCKNWKYSVCYIKKYVAINLRKTSSILKPSKSGANTAPPLSLSHRRNELLAGWAGKKRSMCRLASLAEEEPKPTLAPPTSWLNLNHITGNQGSVDIW